MQMRGINQHKILSTGKSYTGYISIYFINIAMIIYLNKDIQVLSYRGFGETSA